MQIRWWGVERANHLFLGFSKRPGGDDGVDGVQRRILPRVHLRK